MSESKSQSIFPLWESLGKLITDLSHAQAHYVPIGPSLFPHAGTRDQRLVPPPLRITYGRPLSPNPGNTICCISFESHSSD